MDRTEFMLKVLTEFSKRLTILMAEMLAEANEFALTGEEPWTKREQEEQRQRRNEYQRVYVKQRQASDPEYTTRIHQRQALSARTRYNSNPQVRAKMLARSHKYQSQKRDLLAELTPEQWTWLLEQSGRRCVYCGRHESEAGRLAQEHIIPVSKGGVYTIANIRPACRSCNSRKKDRTPAEAGMTFAIEINPLAHMTQASLFGDDKK